MAARRRFRRSFAGKGKNGRKMFWLRSTPFAITPREAVTATHSDIFLSEDDWANPSANLNSTQKGGARLERMFIDYGLAVDAQSAFYAASGDAVFALIPEFMIWAQSDQFVTIVNNSSSFDLTRANSRIIADEIPDGRREFSEFNSVSNDRSLRTVQGRLDIKSKVRLADGALGVAWRGLYNESSVNLFGFTDWFRPTILMSIP